MKYIHWPIEKLNRWARITKRDFHDYNKELTEENFRAVLYSNVIREMFSKEHFMHEEQVGYQKGLFIKGYVRDVWQYLDEAYELIHTHKWVKKYRKPMQKLGNTDIRFIRKKKHV